MVIFSHQDACIVANTQTILNNVLSTPCYAQSFLSSESLAFGLINKIEQFLERKHKFTIHQNLNDSVKIVEREVRQTEGMHLGRGQCCGKRKKLCNTENKMKLQQFLAQLC